MAKQLVLAAEVEFDIYPYYRYGVEADKSPHFSGVIRFDRRDYYNIITEALETRCFEKM